MQHTRFFEGLAVFGIKPLLEPPLLVRPRTPGAQAVRLELDGEGFRAELLGAVLWAGSRRTALGFSQGGDTTARTLEPV